MHRKFSGFALALAMASAAVAADPAPLLKAAIFVENRAGKDYDDKIDVLNDLLSTRMTEAGFSVIDKAHVVDTLKKSNSREAQELANTLTRKGKIEESLADNASALRIAQMLRADYLLVAGITTVGKETKRFKADEVSTVNTTHTVRVSVKLLEGNQGGTVYGDVVKASRNIRQTENLQTETDDLLNALLDEAAATAAKNATAKMDKIRSVVVETVGAVEFTLKCNVPDATVELDGAGLGATGTESVRFRAAPGLHQIKVSREWFKPWERSINLYEGQVLTAQLEFTREGLARFKDLESFKAGLKRFDQETELGKKRAETDMALDREQSEAEAYRKKKTADGEAEFMKNSHIRVGDKPESQLSEEE